MVCQGGSAQNVTALQKRVIWQQREPIHCQYVCLSVCEEGDGLKIRIQLKRRKKKSNANIYFLKIHELHLQENFSVWFG